MACAGKSRKSIIATVVPPIVGESGLTLLEHIGDADAETVYGSFTGTAYPFNVRNPLYVDSRDVVYLLGPEFTEWHS